MRIKKLSTCLFLGLLCLVTAAASAQDGAVAEVLNNGRSLEFQPLVEYDHLSLSVTGPCNFQYQKAFGPKDGNPIFELSDETIDGRYRYDLVVMPKIDPRIVELLRSARKKGDDTVAAKLCRQGALPGDPASQTHGFLVSKGEIIFDLKAEEGRLAKNGDSSLGGSLRAAADLAAGPSGFPAKDFVINDDLIVDGSACIGFDCVNGESFGFDTVRLKENNLRIKFDDTSTVASFPRNDWQLTANDSANGGASKFSIDDISNSRTPFTIEANARSHSLYVDDGGRIGSRTSTPSVELHTVDGDTPALRLQQDGSSGFAPQTWDVAGNETNFFVRDVTNGSTLPFRIRPGAASSSIFIDSDSDVGIGTSSPTNPLHVRRTNSTAEVLVEDTGATTSGAQTMMELRNNGAVQFLMNNTAQAGLGAQWQFRVRSDGNFVVSDVTTGGTAQAIFGDDGDLTLAGNVITTNCPSGCGPDYVFADDYPLMSLDELEAFIEENRHLPNVPPAVDMETNGINMTQLQLRLLEKVEELTLYTLELKKEIQLLKQQNDVDTAGGSSISVDQ